MYIVQHDIQLMTDMYIVQHDIQLMTDNSPLATDGAPSLTDCSTEYIDQSGHDPKEGINNKTN